MGGQGCWSHAAERRWAHRPRCLCCTFRSAQHDGAAPAKPPPGAGGLRGQRGAGGLLLAAPGGCWACLLLTAQAACTGAFPRTSVGKYGGISPADPPAQNSSAWSFWGVIFRRTPLLGEGGNRREGGMLLIWGLGWSWCPGIRDTPGRVSAVQGTSTGSPERPSHCFPIPLPNRVWREQAQRCFLATPKNKWLGRSMKPHPQDEEPPSASTTGSEHRGGSLPRMCRAKDLLEACPGGVIRWERHAGSGKAEEHGGSQPFLDSRHPLVDSRPTQIRPALCFLGCGKTLEPFFCCKDLRHDTEGRRGVTLWIPVCNLWADLVNPVEGFAHSQ